MYNNYLQDNRSIVPHDVVQDPGSVVVSDIDHGGGVSVSAKIQLFADISKSYVQFIASAQIIARQHGGGSVGHVHLDPLVGAVVGEGRAPSALDQRGRTLEAGVCDILLPHREMLRAKGLIG